MKGPWNIDNPLTDDGRNKINEMFQELYNEYRAAGLSAEEAREKAHNAVMKSDEAMALSERTQKELSQAILEGDSSPLAGQLSVGADGTVYHDPQERLVEEYENVASELEQKSTVQKETITVKVPSDYASVNAAIKDLSGRKHTYNVMIDIVLESGYEFTIPLSLSNGDYSHFRISSEDEEVFLSDTFLEENFMVFYNCRAPILNCLINANSKCIDGISVYHASTMYITAGSGLKGALQNNLIARYASTVYANYGVFTEASQGFENDGGGGYAGLTSWGSRIYAYGADVSNSKTYGVRAAHGGVVHFQNGIANNCGRHGIRASNAGFLDARSAKANDCVTHGIYALAGSTINAYEAEAKNAGNTGIFANQASTIDARQAIVDGSTSGVVADQNSRINFFGGSGNNCIEYVVLATRLSEVNARSAVGIRAREGVRAEEGSKINFRLGNIQSSANYNLIATEGSEINADLATIKDTRYEGTGHGVYAEKGSKITVTGASVTGSLGNDLRVNQAGVIVAHDCTTTNSTDGKPHINDINLSAFNTIQSSLGIIWAATS